jgi:serine protease Do
MQLLGMKVRNLDDSLKQKFNFKNEAKGVVVLEVAYGSEAYLKGIRPGDIIIELNKKEVSNVYEMSKIYETIKDGEDVLVFIEGKNSRYVVLTKVKD